MFFSELIRVFPVFQVWILIPLTGAILLALFVIYRLRLATEEKRKAHKLEVAKEEEKKMLQLLFLRCTQTIKAKQHYLNGRYPIEDLATDINSNKTYISKAINSQSGLSYPQYLNKLRIEYALDIMKKDPHMTLGDVAIFSGFSHQSSFTDSFKKFVGVSPRTYMDSLMYLDSAVKLVDQDSQIAEYPSRLKVQEQSGLSQFS